MSNAPTQHGAFDATSHVAAPHPGVLRHMSAEARLAWLGAQMAFINSIPLPAPPAGLTHPHPGSFVLPHVEAPESVAKPGRGEVQQRPQCHADAATTPQAAISSVQTLRERWQAIPVRIRCSELGEVVGKGRCGGVDGGLMAKLRAVWARTDPDSMQLAAATVAQARHTASAAQSRALRLHHKHGVDFASALRMAKGATGMCVEHALSLKSPETLQQYMRALAPTARAEVTKAMGCAGEKDVQEDLRVTAGVDLLATQVGGAWAPTGEGSATLGVHAASARHVGGDRAPAAEPLASPWELVGYMDGVGEKVDGSGRVVVEVKHRVSHLHDAPPMADALQIQAYLRMWDAREALYVQRLMGQGETKVCTLSRFPDATWDGVLRMVQRFVTVVRRCMRGGTGDLAVQRAVLAGDAKALGEALGAPAAAVESDNSEGGESSSTSGHSDASARGSGSDGGSDSASYTSGAGHGDDSASYDSVSLAAEAGEPGESSPSASGKSDDSPPSSTATSARTNGTCSPACSSTASGTCSGDSTEESSDGSDATAAEEPMSEGDTHSSGASTVTTPRSSASSPASTTSNSSQADTLLLSPPSTGTMASCSDSSSSSTSTSGSHGSGVTTRSSGSKGASSRARGRVTPFIVQRKPRPPVKVGGVKRTAVRPALNTARSDTAVLRPKRPRRAAAAAASKTWRDLM